MICTARCAAMIYQACGLDKKIRQADACRIFWRRKRDSKCPAENIVVSVGRRRSLPILLIFVLVPLPSSATGGGRVPSPRRQAVARVRIFRLFIAKQKYHPIGWYFCLAEKEMILQTNRGVLSLAYSKQHFAPILSAYCFAVFDSLITPHQK